LDKLFGTFRERLGKSKEYKGEAGETKAEKVSASNDFLSGGLAVKDMVPTSLQSTVYNTLAYATFAAFCAAAVGKINVDPVVLATALAIGPVLFGLVVLTVFGDHQSYLW
jgi:hypothetical protein